MANKLAKAEGGSFRFKKKLNNWKFPTIPIGEVYKDNLFQIFPSYAVKDFEETITLNGDCNPNVSFELLSSNFQKSFIKKHHRFMHLGLVQIAVKPLIRDGLGTPVAVCLRDTRHLDFQNSLLALVESDLSEGPFYFNCYPSFSFSLADVSSFEIMILKSRTPLALTYRVVCKAMLDLSPEALKEPILGETAYFQPATGTNGTTKWEEYESKVHESFSADKQESEAQDGIALETLPDGPDLQQGRSMAIKLVNEGGENSPIKMHLDDWKYPKIPINEVYNHSHDKIVSVYGYGPSFWSKAKKKLSVFPSSVVKDFEKTITLKASDQNVSLRLLKGFNKFLNNGYVHFGLVQIAIKPLMSDGLGDPVIVCLTDARVVEFEQSLLSVVQSDLSHGPFYFDCCPGYTIPWKDREILTLNVMTSGIPLALTYRVVCKASTDITLDVRGSIRRETTYFQPMSTTGTESTTKWDEVQFPESWTNV